MLFELTFDYRDREEATKLKLNTEAQKYGGAQRTIDSELMYKIIGAAVEVQSRA